MIYKREGESLTIYCPGAYRLSSIQWKNGSDFLTESLLYSLTLDRVVIDVNNSLTFHNLSMLDNGTYRCYDRGIYKLKVLLLVGPPEMIYHDTSSLLTIPCSSPTYRSSEPFLTGGVDA